MMRKSVTWNVADVLVRLAALILGLVSFAASSRFAFEAGFSIDLLMLSHVVLMLMCTLAPMRPSRYWFNALLAVAALTVFYYAVRELPYRINEHFPVEVMLVDLVQILVVSWFLGTRRPEHQAIDNPL